MDEATVASYDTNAQRWYDERSAGAKRAQPRIAAFVRRRSALDHDGPVVDLGCGPAWHSPDLGPAVIATDASAGMLAVARREHPDIALVRHDLEALPFARGALAGVWANKSLQHIPAEHLPLALAELHRVTTPGAPLHLTLTDTSLDDDHDDPFGARYFSRWSEPRAVAVVEGGGFVVESVEHVDDWIVIEATRARRLPDFVRPDLRLLLVGLNPSLYSADVGVGFARPGNRFWPAALRAEMVSVDRDPLHAVRNHGIGFTDLVKRATVRADECSADEFRAGAERVAALCAWLHPHAVCFVGLSGYRSAVDRRATAGWQPDVFGGVPAYVMPNPSGLNAHTNVDDLADHFRRALQGPDAVGH